MATSSHEYVVGSHKDSFPHYHVELTEDYLLEFEMLNSLCSLESYDQLFYFFESNMNRKRLPVPPSDVVVVIFTIAAMSEHYKDHALRVNDPYNVARVSLPVRAIKLLNRFLRILEEFDSKLYDLYALELLRCQLFIVIDHLTPTAANPKILRNERDPQKRRKTNSGVLYKDVSYRDDVVSQKFNNYYASYVSVLEHNPKIVQSIPLTSKLNQEGGFWNCIAWALFTSVSETPRKYYCGRSWLPILDVIFQLYDLRHSYFMNFELENCENDTIFCKSMEKSPLSQMFNALGSHNIQTILCDYLFIGCDYSLAGKIYVHSTYHHELETASTYVSNVEPSMKYKLRISMKLRRQVLKLFCRLIQSIPAGLQLNAPKISEKEFLVHISRVLISFESLEQLKYFFFTTDLKNDLDYLPLIAQTTLEELTSCLGNQKRITIVENLGGDDIVINELLTAFACGLPKLNPEYEGSRENLYKLIQKCDICVIVLLRYLVYIHGSSSLKLVDEFDDFMAALIENDNERVLFVDEMNWEDAPPPLLYTWVRQLFS